MPETISNPKSTPEELIAAGLVRRLSNQPCAASGIVHRDEISVGMMGDPNLTLTVRCLIPEVHPEFANDCDGCMFKRGATFTITPTA
ncbi:MAG: hypothetical protein WCV93_05905 [Candidatus Shapirobacteria bacterium]|jgi:hypothetical protein